MTEDVTATWAVVKLQLDVFVLIVYWQRLEIEKVFFFSLKKGDLKVG